MKLLFGLIVFVAGFLTAKYFDSDTAKHAASDSEFAKQMWQKDSAELDKDIAICKKIYAARDKINAALGLPEDDSDPLNLGLDSEKSGDSDYEKYMDKTYGPIRKNSP